MLKPRKYLHVQCTLTAVWSVGLTRFYSNISDSSILWFPNISPHIWNNQAYYMQPSNSQVSLAFSLLLQCQTITLLTSAAECMAACPFGGEKVKWPKVAVSIYFNYWFWNQFQHSGGSICSWNQIGSKFLNTTNGCLLSLLFQMSPLLCSFFLN